MMYQPLNISKIEIRQDWISTYQYWIETVYTCYPTFS